MVDTNEAIYEVEAYQAVFTAADGAIKWLENKRKLLEDAGLKVVQFSMYEPANNQFNVNIQASRGAKPGGEPMF